MTIWDDRALPIRWCVIIEGMPDDISISVIWPDVADLPVYRANQFLLQPSMGPDSQVEDLVLTVGHVAPPVVLGTAEEQAASMRALGAVSAKAVSRVAISVGVAEQLLQLLSIQIQYAKQHREGQS